MLPPWSFLFQPFCCSLRKRKDMEVSGSCVFIYEYQEVRGVLSTWTIIYVSSVSSLALSFQMCKSLQRQEVESRSLSSHMQFEEENELLVQGLDWELADLGLSRPSHSQGRSPAWPPCCHWDVFYLEVLACIWSPICNRGGLLFLLNKKKYCVSHFLEINYCTYSRNHGTLWK